MSREGLSLQKWHIYKGAAEPRTGPLELPVPPPWRRFDGGPAIERDFETDPRSAQLLRDLDRASTYQVSQPEIDMVNAALYLRRPLLVTGDPGAGKSTLAYSVARELRLGPVLRWNITSRSSLKDGLYDYDAIGRLQEYALHQRGASLDAAAATPEIGQFMRLGPLGTAFLPSRRPRVVLIDEIDKSDIDLPNDLLNVFEEGEFMIPELFRLRKESREIAVFPADGDHAVPIRDGRVRCREFPIVFLTSNAEREFSPAFLRRCLQLRIPVPDKKYLLLDIVNGHMPLTGDGASTVDPLLTEQRGAIVDKFLTARSKGKLATDQLMNAVFMVAGGMAGADPKDLERLLDGLLQPLGRTEA